MSGWIKLKRTIFDHWIASDNDYLSVWIRMLSEANFEDKTKLFNGSLITVKRGQIVFGLQAWSEKTGVQISKLRRLISMLESDSMINRQVFNKYSLISIVNYELHQSDDRQDSSQTTGKPQANDRQTTTPKELKNIRNKEVKYHVDSDEPTSDKTDFVGDQFARFWKNYPTKKAKVAAEKAFRRLTNGKKESQVRFWVDMILNYHFDCIEREEIGADQLHAATLINQRRWEDSPEFVENFKLEWVKENANNGTPV